MSKGHWRINDQAEVYFCVDNNCVQSLSLKITLLFFNVRQYTNVRGEKKAAKVQRDLVISLVVRVSKARFVQSAQAGTSMPCHLELARPATVPQRGLILLQYAYFSCCL